MQLQNGVAVPQSLQDFGMLQSKSEQSGKPLLAYFTASYCKPCKKIGTLTSMWIGYFFFFREIRAILSHTHAPSVR